MITFLVNRYTIYSKNYKVVGLLKGFLSILRFSIRIFSNFFLPLYFVIFKSNRHSLTHNYEQNKEKKVIVSLTTFPNRISKLWLVIECMLRQTVKPDRIILWLSKKQFSSEESLPKKLIRMKNRGLEIILCDEDLRSHKKYYYTLKKFPKDIIVTVDDDFFYPTTLIQSLLETYKLYPNSICACRAMEYDIKEGKVNSYLTWKYLEVGRKPSHKLFFTSGGGTLFTSQMFHKEVLNKEVFVKKCLLADDIWLNIMAQMNATKIAKSSYHFEGIPILNFDDITLASQNVGHGLNDKQWNDVNNYYHEKKPLLNILR